MFKHLYSSRTVRYLLDSRLQSYVLNNINKFMKKIEWSLLYNAYPKIDDVEENEVYSNNIESLSEKYKSKLIRERISRLCITDKENILNLDEITSKKLLIGLYENYLREEMIEYASFKMLNDIKEEKEKKEENFKTYLEKNNKTDLIIDFESELKELLNNETLLENVYIKRPTYFLLYRIRNNILKEVRETNCSRKHIENVIKGINNKYSELYLIEFNRRLFKEINDFNKLKENIIFHIEEELREIIRSGKVVKIGNELADKFKENIDNDIDYKLLNDKYNQISIENKTFDEIKNIFLEYQEEYILLSKKYLDEETKINKFWIKDDLNNFLLYTVSEFIVDSLDASRYEMDNKLLSRIENEVISYIKSEYFKKVNYDTFIQVQNVELEDDKEIKYGNITFNKAQKVKENLDTYLGYKASKFEQEFFENIKDTDIIIKMNGIQAYQRDSDIVEQKMLNEINDVMNVLYFCTAREKSKIYTLGRQTLIIDKNSSFKQVKYSSNRDGIFDFEIVESKWLNNILQCNSNQDTKLIIESIKEFNKINNQKDNKRLIEAINKLINMNDLYDTSRVMTILIAGTNIFKYSVNGLELRLWLLEDYIEFLNNQLPYDEFINERFLNFYKRVINIMFSYNDIDDENLLYNLQNWILKIFPNNYEYNEDKYNG